MVIGKKSSNRFLQLNNLLTNERKRISEHDQFYLQDVVERIVSGKLTLGAHCAKNNLKEINHEEMIKAAIAKEHFYDEFKFASKQLKMNRQFVCECLAINGGILKYLSKEFKNDEDLVLIAVKCYGWALAFASDSLRNNKKVLETAIRSTSGSLCYASKELQLDSNLVGLAVWYNPAAMVFSKFDIDQPHQAILISSIVLNNGQYLDPLYVRSNLFPTKKLNLHSDMNWLLELLICSRDRKFISNWLDFLKTVRFPKDNYLIHIALISAFKLGVRDMEILVELGLRFFSFIPQNLFHSFLDACLKVKGRDWVVDFIRKKIGEGHIFSVIVGAAYFCLNEQTYSYFKPSFEYFEKNFSTFQEHDILLFSATYFLSHKLCAYHSFSLLGYPNMWKDSKVFKILELLPEKYNIKYFFLGYKYLFMESYQSHRAFNYFYSAALNGLPEAMYNVAIMYKHGEGVSADYSEFQKWILRAAENGSAHSMHYIAEMGFNGEEDMTPQDMFLCWYVAALRDTTFREGVIEKLMRVVSDFEYIIACINKMSTLSVRYKILNAIIEYSNNIESSVKVMRNYGYRFGEDFLQKIPSNKCSYCNSQMFGFNFTCDCYYVCVNCKHNDCCQNCGKEYSTHHYLWNFIEVFRYVYDKCKNSKLKHLIDILSSHFEINEDVEVKDDSLIGVFLEYDFSLSS